MKYLILLLAIALTACGDCENVSDSVCKASKAGGAIPTSYEVNQTTTQGAATHGAKGLSATQLSLIDAGIAGAIADAGTYTQGLNHSRYEIFIPNYSCELSPEQRVPSFMLRADSYDGTEFDQYNSKGAGVRDNVGVVYAAEMVLSLGTGNVFNGQMVVCPDISHLKDAVRHGTEHIVIALNDPEYFNLTWYHGNGFSHPLLPKRTNLRELPRKHDGKMLIRVVK